MVLPNTDAYANAYGFPYDAAQAQLIEDRNDSSSYSYIPEIPRLYLRSHIFGGSHIREERKALVFDHNTKSLVYKKITTPKLQERVFLEIISNAIDNAFKSQRMGVAAPTLDVEMNADMVSVRSTGVPIPVDFHEYFYVNQKRFGTCAELIMSVIGAGGNTDDTKAKQGGGVNGYGAKLTNVFARFFQIEIGDNIRGFHEVITWKDNMMVKESHVITPNYAMTDRPDNEGKYHIYPINQSERYNGENFVKITWKQDFRKFGRDYFVEEDMELYMKYVVEASFIAKFKATFNGMDLTCNTPTQFVHMLPKSLQKGTMIHYELGQATLATQRQVEDAVASLQLVPILELVIIDSPGQDNMHISYTNGVWQSAGGVHTDAVYRAILDVIKQSVSTMKGMQDFDFSKLTIRDIKNHCTVILNYRCISPVFKGQDKEKLDKPEPKITFSPEEIAKIKKFDLTNVIYRLISGKILGNMTVNTSRFKNEENFRDADWYGTKRQKDCVMLICEGNSAGGYLKDWIYGTPERTNKYCYLLLRGKLLNVTGKDLAELLSDKNGNDVIKKIVKCMGFEYGVDYRTAEGAARLRYPELWALTDADSDGFHIQCLLKNFIHTFFPTFLMAGRFRYVPTPVIRILTAKKKGKTKKVFYTMSSYEKYKRETGDVRHESKHFKGLGSGGVEFASEDAKISPIVTCAYDEYAAYSMDIAFGKSKDSANKRKIWVEQCRYNVDSDIIRDWGSSNPREKYVNTTDYVNTRLVEYSIDSFKRALPCAYDGLKLSQRQSIWHILVDWKYGHSTKGTKNLAAIAGEAKTRTHYHHGDLSQTIARMAQRYPGSNNVPLLTVSEGQFGSREKQGSDIGQPRYVSTDPEDIIKLLFDEELTKMIPQNVEEGEDVEPYWLPCKLPLHILNGCLGVATAYSIDQPSYHPMDVCQWIMNYITGQMVFAMMPWFMGFQGVTEIEIVKGKHKVDKTLLTEEQINEHVKYYEGLTLTTKGNYTVLQERTAKYSIDDPNNPDPKKKTKEVIGIVKDILITEIPIGIATDSYITWLETKCEKVDRSGTTNADTPILKVIGWRGDVNHKSLRLIRRQGINNISLIDEKGIPVQLRNVYQMLKLYCDNMISLYKDYKIKRLDEIKAKIHDEQMMCNLIELVITDKILVFRQKRANIFNQMSQHGIDKKYYEKVGLKGLDEDGYAEHLEKLQKLLKEYSDIEQRHELFDWCEDLRKIFDIFSKDNRYKKYAHHEYPFNLVDISQLTSGRIKSPFPLKEENDSVPLTNEKITQIQQQYSTLAQNQIGQQSIDVTSAQINSVFNSQDYNNKYHGIDFTQVQILTDDNGYQWFIDPYTNQYVQYVNPADNDNTKYQTVDPSTGQVVYYNPNITDEEREIMINTEMDVYIQKVQQLSEKDITPDFIRYQHNETEFDSLKTSAEQMAQNIDPTTGKPYPVPSSKISVIPEVVTENTVKLKTPVSNQQVFSSAAMAFSSLSMTDRSQQNLRQYQSSGVI